MATAAISPEIELADELALCYADPLRFVLLAFPWGEKGTPLADHSGPDEWQTEVLREIGAEVQARGFNGFDSVPAIRQAVASGHGIGKSVLVAWLVCWIMCTRPHCKGTVTANTFAQLESKTWPSILHWMSMCIARHWFETGASKIYHREHRQTWFVTAQSCAEENSEAFAGQHAADSSSFYVFDEASAIPDKIWEVAEGGLTDGEPMIFAFGNPTRSSGKFYRITFGAEQGRWKVRSIDSRTARFTNKQQIDEWIADYGEDSDFVRVRVRGLPPSASELQFIDRKRAEGAQGKVVHALHDEPLIAGFDVSGGGSAWNVIRFRRGPDARSIPPIRIAGEKGRDRGVLIGVCAELLRDSRPSRKIAAMFVDSAFGSPIVERLRSMGFDNVHEINFGGESPDSHQDNMRAYMWYRMKDWLTTGSLPMDGDEAEPDKTNSLVSQMCRPGYHMNKRNRLVLESKADMQKRGEASPDDADALALTFSRPVAPLPRGERNFERVEQSSNPDSWMA